MSENLKNLVSEVENASELKSNNHTDNKMLLYLKKYGIIFALILLIVGISIAEPKFLNPINIFNVLTQSSIYGIMALGMTLVIIAKGIDLSVGSILAFSGIVAASLGQVATAVSYTHLRA